MILSTITACSLVDTDGVIEKYDVFDPSEQRTFNRGLRLLDEDSVYERHGDSIYVKDFDTNKEDYNLNDVVWKDDLLQYISNVTGTVAKQPEEYTNDTDLNSTNWENRYLKMSTFTSGKHRKQINKISDDLIYVYDINIDENEFKVAKWNNPVETGSFTSSSDCSDCDDGYKALDIAKIIATKKYVYNIKEKICMYNPRTGDCNTTNIYSSRATDINGVELQTDEILPVGTIIYIDGKPIKVGHQINGSYYKYYRYDLASIQTSNFKSLNNSSLEATEEKAIVRDDPLLWTAKTIIYRGDAIYVRTNVSARQETKEVTDVQTEPLTHINQINWGWTYVEPSQKIAPLDTKAYTILEQNSIVKYTIKAKDNFDMVAVSKLYASKVEVRINGQLDTFNPKCIAIKNGREFKRSVTSFYYFNTVYPKNTEIEITFYPLNGIVRLGIGVLGYKIPLGLTIKRFKIPPKDFGFYEQDDFGNVNYIEKAKLKRVTYYVDIAEIEDGVIKDGDLDFTIETLTENMGRIIVIDANDNIDNLEFDNKNRYKSISMIGRFRAPEIDVKDNKDDITANYTFTAEEIV